MAEDEAISYFRIVVHSFPALITDKTFNAGRLNLAAYLQKVKFTQAERYVVLLEQRFREIQQKKQGGQQQ
jgi:hypothetical protein